MTSILKVCFAAVFLSSLSIAHATPPQISAARIIQPPPGAKVAAAYFTLSNESDERLDITGVSSDDIPSVSIHLSAIVDDVAKMIPQESVSVEAGGSLEFKHGSYHIMLMGLTAPLVPGSMIALEIETSAGILPIMIPIITPDEASNMKPHTMDHDSMKKDSKKMKPGHSDDSIKHTDMDTSKSMETN